MTVLNEHKRCIITAVNDEAQYNEMLAYTNCLETMVQEFRSHPEYGIAGVVGSHDIPSSGIWIW